MNNFHVYEAIGRGKHSVTLLHFPCPAPFLKVSVPLLPPGARHGSARIGAAQTVYKGRKKKTIEYFAVKSVDKSQRSKVLNEVRMLHSLDHTNVLKFYSWYETSAHFWLVLEYCVGGDLKGLLEQPAFDNMIELSTTPYLAEGNGDRPSRQLTPPKPREYTGLRKKDENFTKAFTTPVKNVQSGKRTSAKPKADAFKGVNILRMSRIAKLNLQRERDKENYRRPPTETSENETEVKIENNDMELDFGENPEGDLTDDTDGSDHPGSAANEKPQAADGNEENCMANQVDMLTDEGPVKPDTMMKTDQNSCSDNLDVVATPPSICMRKAQRAKARDDFQMTLLRVLEAATEEPSVILKEHKIFTSRIIPSLSILYKGNRDGDSRFLCLKILSDVIIVIFSDSSLTADEQTIRDLKSISQKHFLPLYPSFAEDEDPIPIYAQKLLVMLMEHDCVKVSDILHKATVSQCFEFSLGDLSNANVSNVKLCFALASAPEMDTHILSQLQVVRRIGNLLEFVAAKDMDDFLEPTLELCRAFIVCGIGSNRSVALSKNPALLVDNAFSMSIAVDQQTCVMDICDFGGNMGIFIELVGNSDSQISDLASDCVVLLLKAAPREATVGLLTNLPKLSAVMDLLKHDSCLRLTRLLYGLAFSCRQYLAQGMILSLSVSAMMRVEALVSAFKGSSDNLLADAASYLGAELQRLPRCG
nr:unnamed protein product [Digitaria exilis]